MCFCSSSCVLHVTSTSHFHECLSPKVSIDSKILDFHIIPRYCYKVDGKGGKYELRKSTVFPV